MGANLWQPSGANLVIQGDNLPLLRELEDAAFQLIYIDPPFNTGKVQSRQSISTRRVASPGRGTRQGFKGESYESIRGLATSYNDSFAQYWAFLGPRLREAWRLLSPTGTFYLHLDYREVHYAKVLLDQIFGPECFLNEIIWAYDYGARAKRRWPAKHDNILVYVKDPRRYFFDNTEVDREPYMAPGLVTPQKAAKGKLPTDVWWHTLDTPPGKATSGCATKNPEGILRRIVQASSREGDWVLDFFAGSGTTGAVAGKLGRKFLLIDENPQAVEIITRRLEKAEISFETRAT